MEFSEWVFRLFLDVINQEGSKEQISDFFSNFAKYCV
jgi:hypothetical protein